MNFDLLSFLLGVFLTLAFSLMFWGEWIERMDCLK